jgi:hypothetical protein
MCGALTSVLGPMKSIVENLFVVATALAAMLPATSRPSGEFPLVVYESWSRSPHEVVYIKAGELSGRLEELCIQTKHYSVRIPPQAFPKTGWVDVSSTKVFWSGGPIIDPIKNTAEMSSVLSVQVRHDPAPDENGNPSIQTSVDLIFNNNEPVLEARVSSLIVGSSENSRPKFEKNVKLKISSSSACPIPKAVELGNEPNYSFKPTP